MRALTLSVFMLGATTSVTAKRALFTNKDLGTASSPLDAIDRFKAMSKEAFGEIGAKAAELAYNLEFGASKLQTGVTSSSCSGCEGPLDVTANMTLTVTHPRLMQGEMATPSHMPLMWTLDKTTTYTLVSDTEGGGPFGGVKLMTEGVGLSGFPEGLKLYKDSKCEEACNSTKGDLLSRATCERDVLFKFFKGKWNSMKVDSHLHDAKNKIARVLKPMYGSYATFGAVRAKGKEAWPKIVYGMATIPKTAIDFFRFYTEDGKPLVSMTQHESDISWASLLLKNGADFSPKKFATEYKMGAAFAASGMNFAAMVAAGRTDLNGAKVKGGNAEKILKLASDCQMWDQPDGYGDRTAKCKGSEGRVVWQ